MPPIEQVFCDVCLKDHGVSSPMTGPELRDLSGPMMHAPLGRTFECYCGRLYSEKAGYFSFVKGEGMKRNRPHPRCNSDHLAPLYISRHDRASSTTRFACPECGTEIESAL